jgi:hypothetical protein
MLITRLPRTAGQKPLWRKKGCSFGQLPKALLTAGRGHPFRPLFRSSSRDYFCKGRNPEFEAFKEAL